MLDLLQCVAAGIDNTEIKSVQPKGTFICQIKVVFLLVGLYFPFMIECFLSTE